VKQQIILPLKLINITCRKKNSSLVFGYVSTKQTYVSQNISSLMCASTLGSWQYYAKVFEATVHSNNCILY